jgi:hypothetical protein
MKAVLQIKRVEDAMEWMESEAESYTSSQSIPWMIDQIGLLCKTMAFLNGQMTVAEEALNKRKVKAYESLAASSVANQDYFAPSLAKDYIAARCHAEQYDYTVCERASRTCYHTLEALRSVLSALKEEVKVQNYQGQQ